MAYTVVMTKKSVDKRGSLYTITINCVVNDGTSDVFERDVSRQYNPVAPNLDDLKSQILQEFRAEWDEWVDEQGIANSQAMDNALSDMQTTATTYVNG